MFELSCQITDTPTMQFWLLLCPFNGCIFRWTWVNQFPLGFPPRPEENLREWCVDGLDIFPACQPLVSKH